MNVVHAKKRCTGKETKEGGFKKAYDSAVPFDQRKKVREDICALCFWSEVNFRARINGSRYFRIDDVKKIEDYFCENFHVNAWTGLPINN